MADTRPAPHRLPAPLDGARFTLGFLSRFPTVSALPDAGALGWAIVWFPWVGAALGGAAAILAEKTDALSNGAPLASGVIYAAFLAYVSRGLHLDGLADLTDGLAGGLRDRERALAIMRDSRMGALGGVAVSMLLLAKVVFSAELVRREALCSVALAPAAARGTLTGLVVALPYARTSGLGAELCRSATWWGTTLAVVPLVAVAHRLGLVFPLLGAVAGASWVGFIAMRRLGGATGDVYGAAVELSEVCWLLVALGVERLPEGTRTLLDTRWVVEVCGGST